MSSDFFCSLRLTYYVRSLFRAKAACASRNSPRTAWARMCFFFFVFCLFGTKLIDVNVLSSFVAVASSLWVQIQAARGGAELLSEGIRFETRRSCIILPLFFFAPFFLYIWWWHWLNLSKLAVASGGGDHEVPGFARDRERSAADFSW